MMPKVLCRLLLTPDIDFLSSTAVKWLVKVEAMFQCLTTQAILDLEDFGSVTSVVCRYMHPIFILQVCQVWWVEGLWHITMGLEAQEGFALYTVVVVSLLCCGFILKYDLKALNCDAHLFIQWPVTNFWVISFLRITQLEPGCRSVYTQVQHWWF